LNVCTSTSTVVPFCVSVTVPNGAVPQVPVQWSLVKLKDMALAGTATASPTTSKAAISSPLPTPFEFLIIRFLFPICLPPIILLRLITSNEKQVQCHAWLTRLG